MFKYILTFLWEFIMDKKNDQTSKSGVGKKIIIFALIAGSFTINYVAINRLYAVSKAHIELSKKFKEIVGDTWEKKRQSFSMMQDKIVQTLVELDIMTEESARNWCKNAKSSYDFCSGFIRS